MSPDTQDNLPAIFGDRRVLAALLPDQRDRLVMIPADGEKLVATALEEETRLFDEWRFVHLTKFLHSGPES